MFVSLLIALNIYNVASSSCGDYHYAFVIDESASVEVDNYQKTIDFVIDLIENHIKSTAQLTALAFDDNTDWIYRFSQPQLPRKKLQPADADGIIDQLNHEKNDYDAGGTHTKHAMEAAITEFKTNSFTQNNILILITDGQPGDNPCDSTVINNLITNNIRVIIVGVSGFDPAPVTCLVRGQTNDIIKIIGFDFSPVVTRLEAEQVICLPQCLNYNPCTQENITAGAFLHPSCSSCCYFIQCDVWGNMYEMACAAGTYWNADRGVPGPDVNMGQCTDPGCSFSPTYSPPTLPTFYIQSSCSDSFDDISENIGKGATQWFPRDDDRTRVSIGFRFTFYGLDYSDILLSSNGFMSFDLMSKSLPSLQIILPDVESPNNWILMYQDDLDPANNNGDESVAYQTKGVAPNRQFIYQFTMVPEWPNEGGNTFQAVLYETTNIIQLRYGNLNAYDAREDVPGIGIENIDGTYGILVDASTVSAGDCFEFRPKTNCPYFGTANPCYDLQHNNPCLSTTQDALYYPSCISVCNYIQCDGHGGGTEKECALGTVWDSTDGTCVHAPEIRGEYYLGPSGTWNDADLYCQLNGGDLASIHSQEDFEAVVAICETNCHIGMRYDGQQLWYWVDGSKTDFGFNNDGSVNEQTPPWEGSWTWNAAQTNDECQIIYLNGATGYFDANTCDAEYPAICYGEPPTELTGALNHVGDNNTLNFLLDH